MKTHGLDPYIAENPFFAGLDQKYIELMTGCAKNVVIRADEYIFRHGGAADEFYILRHGTVSLEATGPQSDPRTILTLESHDVLGWSWLFPPHKWLFDARALELTRAVALDGKCLRAKCEADPAFGYEIMKRFSELVVDRLQATRMQLLDMYGIARA